MTVYTMNRESESTSVPRVLAVTGGKGGIGKTSLAVNLAIALSKNGSKVCLLDADMGLANVNIMLGLHPAYTLEHLFTGEKNIQDIVIEGPEGIHIVPGASGFADCVELDVGQQQRLISSLKSIEPFYDYLLVDTAAGIAPTVLHFIAASQVSTVVVTPEPTSLTDAFSLVKVLKRRGYKRRIQVVVNMCANSSQADKVYRRFSHAVDKYLSLKTEYLGSVWLDESMRTAVTLQRPVALFPKNDPSARSFYRLAERVDDVFSRPGIPQLAFSAYWEKLLEAHASRRQKELSESRQVVSESPTRTMETSELEGASKSQVERQIEESQRKLESSHGEHAATEGSDQSPPESENEAVLSSSSEQDWIDLRRRLNDFISNETATPEQVTTLLSSVIFGFGERLGAAAIDVLQGLLSTIEPSSLDDEHKKMLRAEFDRLAIVDNSTESTEVEEVIEVDANLNERYDTQGFGCQKDLASTIRSSSDKVPLESLLESIKYASLVDDSMDESLNENKG